MPVQPERTPNPNALKFTVGEQVGGPATYSAGSDTDNPLAGALLAIEGVTSVFMTADFLTVTKAAVADWDDITPAATDAIDAHFS